MEAERPVPTVDGMHDDFESDVETLESLEGATPALYAHFFVAGDGERTRRGATAVEKARRDAMALAAALAPGAAAVNAAERADLIVTGSALDGAPGRVTLEPSALRRLDGARAAVAAAPRGLAARDDYAVRRIDVGIDGSRESAAALAAAVRLALAHGAALRLIGVAPIDFDVDGTSRAADPRERDRLARHLELDAHRLAGLSVEAELREGRVDQILLGLTREADLLVLGSRATYGGAGEVAIGDLAGRILREARCPTLVVPAP